jgi:RHS repeat-associated protein
VNSPLGTETYEYNPIGETTRRVKAGTNQTLSWDREGRVSSVTDNGKTTSFIYTADGTRLIRKDPSGATLYLGKQEIRLPAGGVKPTVTRYYTHGDATIAMHDGGKLQYLAADHQGTSQLAIDTTTLTVTRRRQTPYGAPRGAAVTWPGERGFVGGTKDDSTGLTHLGAREYDPDIGRFLSVDPVMDPLNSQQLNGYAYSDNNPITLSDPSGLTAGSWCVTQACINEGLTAPGLQAYGIPTPGAQLPGQGSKCGSRGSCGGLPGRTSKCGSRGGCGIRDAWTKDHSPISNDKDLLLDWFVDIAGTNVDRGEYWFPSIANEVVCFGRLGCNKAYQELTRTGNVDEAKAIAATYCINNFQECSDAADTYGLLGGITDGVRDMAFEALSRGAYSKPCSFAGDTEVLMADGTTKPISEVDVGDQVLATDPETGETGPRTVTAVFAHDDVLIGLSTEDGSTVTTTEDHPFYNATDRAWERADELDRGDTLRTSTGIPTRVTGLLLATAHVGRAYNLTVDDLHTYHVLVGTAAVLVHNDCGIRIEVDDYSTWAKVGPKDYARVERAGGTLNVTDVFRREQEAIRGSDLIAAALKHQGVRRGEIVMVTGIENQATQEAYKAGRSAASSVLGRTAVGALSKLGLNAKSIDWVDKRGKLAIAIEIG